MSTADTSLDIPEEGTERVEHANFLPASLPCASRFDRTRWATARTESVDQVLGLWSEEPDLVRVFEDPRLGRAELVMLRKDRYDQLVKLLQDLVSGQAGIRLELEGLAQVQVALQSAVKKTECDPLLDSLVELVANFVGRLKSSVVVFNKTRRGLRSPVDEATLEYLRREEEEEGEANEPSGRPARAGES